MIPFPEVLLSPEDNYLRYGITCISEEGYAMFGEFHLHRIILGEKKGYLIDHVNQVKLDNRRSNLRHTTKRENALNSKIRSDNRLGIKGVRWNAVNRKWNAYTVIHGTQKQLYYGADFFLACCARKSYEANHV